MEGEKRAAPFAVEVPYKRPEMQYALTFEISQSCSADSDIVDITIDAQQAMDPSTIVKARINSFGKVNALVQHEWRPRSLVTLCAEVDIKSTEKRPKVGLAVAVS
ncbi:mitochondrial outer membrane protein porin of 36 kDa-like [Silene latifolia]|uniref:mitochondrial outer membrane protein porin of 36 kDa-like n=1 Tax=Silene latifolia TaxID=37657 RepID=UPI003D77B9B0